MSIENETEGLLDTIHKCLMCNSEAYDCEECEFVCSDVNCNFKWKVIIRG